MASKNGTINGLKIISSRQAWIKDKKGNMVLDTKRYNFYGKVESKCSGMVTKAVNDGVKDKFVEDFVHLPNSIKNDIANYLLYRKNGKLNKKRVVYLVKDKPQKNKGKK